MEPLPPLPRVLCVDDDLDLLESLRLILRRRFQVEGAASGEEALRLLRARPVDVILCDAGLPGLSGPAFLVQARRLAPEITRLLLTGDPGAVLTQPRTAEAQVHQVLEKPVLADDLVRALEEAAAHTAAARVAALRRPPVRARP